MNLIDRVIAHASVPDDERCRVCLGTRENHKPDWAHEFTSDDPGCDECGLESHSDHPHGRMVMKIYTVSFVVPAKYEPDTDDPMTFVFEDENEAVLFHEHLLNYYFINASLLSDSTQTYDSAIQAVVEAIGPSSD